MTSRREDSFKASVFAVCVAFAAASVINFQIDDFAKDSNIDTNRVFPRSKASNERTVWLFSGECISIGICLPEEDTLTVSNVKFSNDGESDIVAVDIDENIISSFNSSYETSFGSYWNIFADTGPIGLPVSLAAGSHVLTLTVVEADDYGVELDEISLVFGGKYRLADILCPGNGVSKCYTRSLQRSSITNGYSNGGQGESENEYTTTSTHQDCNNSSCDAIDSTTNTNNGNDSNRGICTGFDCSDKNGDDNGSNCEESGCDKKDEDYPDTNGSVGGDRGSTGRSYDNSQLSGSNNTESGNVDSTSNNRGNECKGYDCNSGSNTNGNPHGHTKRNDGNADGGNTDQQQGGNSKRINGSNEGDSGMSGSVCSGSVCGGGSNGDGAGNCHGNECNNSDIKTENCDGSECNDNNDDGDSGSGNSTNGIINNVVNTKNSGSDQRTGDSEGISNNRNKNNGYIRNRGSNTNNINNNRNISNNTDKDIGTGNNGNDRNIGNNEDENDDNRGTGNNYKNTETGKNGRNRGTENNNNERRTGNNGNNRRTENNDKNIGSGNNDNNGGTENNENNRATGNKENRGTVNNDNNRGTGNNANTRGAGNNDNNRGTGNNDNNRGTGNNDNNRGTVNNDNNRGTGNNDNNRGTGNNDNNRGTGNNDNNRGTENIDNKRGTVNNDNNRGTVNNDNNRGTGNIDNKRGTVNNDNNRGNGNIDIERGTGNNGTNRITGNYENNGDTGNNSKGKDTGNNGYDASSTTDGGDGTARKDGNTIHNIGSPDAPTSGTVGSRNTSNYDESYLFECPRREIITMIRYNQVQCSNGMTRFDIFTSEVTEIIMSIWKSSKDQHTHRSRRSASVGDTKDPSNQIEVYPMWESGEREGSCEKIDNVLEEDVIVINGTEKNKMFPVIVDPANTKYLTLAFNVNSTMQEAIFGRSISSIFTVGIRCMDQPTYISARFTDPENNKSAVLYPKRFTRSLIWQTWTFPFLSAGSGNFEMTLNFTNASEPFGLHFLRFDLQKTFGPLLPWAFINPTFGFGGEIVNLAKSDTTSLDGVEVGKGPKMRVRMRGSGSGRQMTSLILSSIEDGDTQMLPKFIFNQNGSALFYPDQSPDAQPVFVMGNDDSNGLAPSPVMDISRVDITSNNSAYELNIMTRSFRRATVLVSIDGNKTTVNLKASPSIADQHSPLCSLMLPCWGVGYGKTAIISADGTRTISMLSPWRSFMGHSIEMQRSPNVTDDQS
ncbi:GATA zinc finger domain-containing protein 14-like [Haliotis cracherodii]|uniref:GATA zinc finger domain-containing protein 14-like n=1 Tax=Haliotis cracherodii TaxID=6455 RepID=UPI0039EC8DE7